MFLNCMMRDLHMMLDLENLGKHETETEQTWETCKADMSGYAHGMACMHEWAPARTANQTPLASLRKLAMMLMT